MKLTILMIKKKKRSRIKYPTMIVVVKSLEDVVMTIVVVNMDGVVRLVIIVILKKDVNPNLVNVTPLHRE